MVAHQVDDLVKPLGHVLEKLLRCLAHAAHARIRLGRIEGHQERDVAGKDHHVALGQVLVEGTELQVQVAHVVDAHALKSAQRPVKRPWRRSTNERTPSAASSVAIRRACWALSSRMAAWGPWSTARREEASEARTASGACSPMRRASSKARCRSVPAGTTSCTKPSRSASAGPNSSPVSK